MKKIVSLFLAVAAAFCMTGCRNSGSGNSSGSSSQPSGTSNQLIVGSVSDLNADMMDGWTNAGQNKSIKALINGYETVSYTKEGMFIVNKTAVRNLETAENADGTKTFTLSLIHIWKCGRSWKRGITTWTGTIWRLRRWPTLPI